MPQAGDDVLVALVGSSRRPSNPPPIIGTPCVLEETPGEEREGPSCSITANALRFCTRSCAAVRLAPRRLVVDVLDVDLAPVDATLGVLRALTLAWHVLVRILVRRRGDAGLRLEVTDRDVFVGHPGIGARLRTGSRGGQTGDPRDRRWRRVRSGAARPCSDGSTFDPPRSARPEPGATAVDTRTRHGIASVRHFATRPDASWRSRRTGSAHRVGGFPEIAIQNFLAGFLGRGPDHPDPSPGEDDAAGRRTRRGARTAR